MGVIKGASTHLGMPSLKELPYTCSPDFLLEGWTPHTSHMLQGTAAWLSPQPALGAHPSWSISPPTAPNQP